LLKCGAKIIFYFRSKTLLPVKINPGLNISVHFQEDLMNCCSGLQYTWGGAKGQVQKKQAVVRNHCSSAASN
jgi:hypothetical protein